MKQLQDLLDWLDSFEKLPFEPTRQNVVEKIWQLQSEIKREQFAIHNVVVSEAECEHPRDRLIMCGDMQTMFKCGKCGKDLSEH